MDFPSAVKTLVEAHASEVRALQNEISNLRVSSNGYVHACQEPTSSVKLSSGKFSSVKLSSEPMSPALPNADKHPESHMLPLVIPRLGGVSNPRGLTPTCSPICTPKLPLQTPCTPDDLLRVNAYDHLNFKTCYSPSGSCSMTCASDRTSAKVSVATEGKGASVHFLTDESVFDALDDSNESFQSWGCNSTDIDMSAEWVQRWVLLTDNLRHNAREFSVHSGWMPEGVRSSNSDDYGCKPGSSVKTESSNKASVLFQVTHTQRAALAKQERQMMSGTKGFGRGSLGGSRKYFRPGRMSGGSARISMASAMLISHPASPLRRVWVLICMVVILYEVFAITMEPFDVVSDTAERIIERIALCYWSLDIVFNFFSGIYVDGKVERRLKVIAVNYLKTWFLFDVFVVVTQAIPLIIETGDLGAATVFKVLRCARSLRLARVFYWLKDELGLSSSVIAGGKLVQFFILLLLFLHCTACLWYEVGKADEGWTNNYEDELGTDAGTRYLASLHWSLAQLQGNTNIYPGKSIGDRVFVVISSYCSIVVLTFFVSSMTDTLFSERSRRKNQIDEERLVCRFFARHDINPEICARAEHYLQLKQKQQHWMEGNDQDQKVLSMFPAPLRALMLSEMRASCLCWHPIFAYLQKYHRSLFVKVCSKILLNQTFEPNDDCFTYGEVGSHAFFFLKGDFVFNAKFDLLSTVSPWITDAKNATRSSKASARGGSNRNMRSTRYSSDGYGSEYGSRILYPSAGGSVSLRLTGKASRLRGFSADSDFSDHLDQTESKEADGDGYGPSSSDKYVMQQRPVSRLRAGDTVSEVSLWLSWVHAGDLCSLEYGESMLISTLELIAVLANHPNDFAIFANYAKRFSKAAKRIRNANNTDQLIELMGFRAVLEIEEEFFRAERLRTRTMKSVVRQ